MGRLNSRDIDIYMDGEDEYPNRTPRPKVRKMKKERDEDKK